jgi:hypothetical protein
LLSLWVAEGAPFRFAQLLVSAFLAAGHVQFRTDLIYVIHHVLLHNARLVRRDLSMARRSASRPRSASSASS